MNMYFTQNCKKSSCIPYRRVWATLFLCVIFFSPFVTKAQMLIPVSDEFLGEWFFDHAEAQERAMNSKDSYMPRSVLLDEFWQKTYLSDMPTQITFMGPFMAHISHPSWSKLVVAVINNKQLEFRVFQENPEDYNKVLDISAIDSYPTVMPTYLFNLNGNRMSLQCNYINYSEAQDKYIEGILTIYYKR